MIIKSLNIEFNGEFVITDIDDCIFQTSKSIKKQGINKRLFYFNNEIYEKNKVIVFENAEMTDWGIEFLELIKKGVIINYKLITASKNRIEILSKKLNIDKSYIIESMSNDDKVIYLNKIDVNSLYVDDKLRVINKIKNRLINTVNYPKRKCFSINRRSYRRQFRRLLK